LASCICFFLSTTEAAADALLLLPIEMRLGLFWSEIQRRVCPPLHGSAAVTICTPPPSARDGTAGVGGLDFAVHTVCMYGQQLGVVAIGDVNGVGRTAGSVLCVCVCATRSTPLAIDVPLDSVVFRRGLGERVLPGNEASERTHARLEFCDAPTQGRRVPHASHGLRRTGRMRATRSSRQRCTVLSLHIPQLVASPLAPATADGADTRSREHICR